MLPRAEIKILLDLYLEIGGITDNDYIYNTD